MICGDLNARTGSQQDFIASDEQIIFFFIRITIFIVTPCTDKAKMSL